MEVVAVSASVLVLVLVLVQVLVMAVLASEPVGVLVTSAEPGPGRAVSVMAPVTMAVRGPRELAVPRRALE